MEQNKQEWWDNYKRCNMLNWKTREKRKLQSIVTDATPTQNLCKGNSTHRYDKTFKKIFFWSILDL